MWDKEACLWMGLTGKALRCKYETSDELILNRVSGKAFWEGTR